MRHVQTMEKIKLVFRYSLPVLKIYDTRYVHYKFSVLAVNIGTRSKCAVTKRT